MHQNIYEVHSDYGSASFTTAEDAIKALWLLGAYHDIKIDAATVGQALETRSFYEAFPLAIIKGSETG